MFFVFFCDCLTAGTGAAGLPLCMTPPPLFPIALNGDLKLNGVCSAVCLQKIRWAAGWRPEPPEDTGTSPGWPRTTCAFQGTQVSRTLPLFSTRRPLLPGGSDIDCIPTSSAGVALYRARWAQLTTSRERRTRLLSCPAGTLSHFNDANFSCE